MGLHKKDKKWPNIQSPHISWWNIDFIHLWILKYWTSSKSAIWLINFRKTLFSIKGMYFCGLMFYLKQAYWKDYFLTSTFRYKGAFSRLNTTMLHKCDHTHISARFLIWKITRVMYTTILKKDKASCQSMIFILSIEFLRQLWQKIHQCSVRILT